MSTPSLTRRLWLAFALMAALTLLSTVIGWISLRVISQVEQTNTQALLPTMNMARQLSEASAYELFSAQNLTNADSEGVWLAQGKMLKAQSLKINHLLQALSEQGFNTSAIARQEKEIAQTLGQQGTLVGEILTLRAQQQQLSRQIAEAAESIAAQAHGQANNAATSAGATQAGIYDLIESGKGDQAERALDRLIDIDLEYVNQMNELRVNALRFKQLIVTLKDAQGLSDAEETDEKLNQLVKILSRRQQRIEDPTVRGSIVLRTFCDDQSWFIEVEDTGCGIPEAKLTAIFKPFVQATGRRGGTGLGLAISASLAEAMGGTLTVTSTLHVGSCFRLQLPVRHPKPASKSAFRKPINLNGLRLLLIEDNMLTQRITAEMLTGKGVKVSVAESANDALRCLAEGESFDVALVDFDLPDYDGLTLAQQLMSQYPAMKRIGFSAHVIDDNLRQRTAGLFCGIIQKPVPREELYRMIAHYLQGKSHNARAMLNEHQLAGDMASVGPEKLRQWIALFKDSALPLVEEIEAARAMNDDVNIKRLAHKLKSGCASLGMTQATEACRELELQPLSDIDIKTIVTQGVTALDAWIADHPSP
ncbi:response regulator [Salmonella enterica]|nr:response regulator [Salmonella enterica]